MNEEIEKICHKYNPIKNSEKMILETTNNVNNDKGKLINSADFLNDDDI